MAVTALSLRYSLPKVLFHTRTVMIPWFDPGKQLPLRRMQVPAHLYHLCYLPASSTLPESQDASSLLNHCCPPLKSQDGISKQAKVKMTGTSAASSPALSWPCRQPSSPCLRPWQLPRQELAWQPCPRLLFMHGTGKQNDIPRSSCQFITEGSWQISILDIPTAHSSSFLKYPVLFSLPPLSHLVSQIMCTQILVLGWCPRDPKTLREENKFYVTGDSLITTTANPWGSDHTAPRCVLCVPPSPPSRLCHQPQGQGSMWQKGLGPEACSLRARQEPADVWMWFCTAYKKKMVDTPCSPKNTESTKTSENYIHQWRFHYCHRIFWWNSSRTEKSRETKVATQGCTMQGWLRCCWGSDFSLQSDADTS